MNFKSRIFESPVFWVIAIGLSFFIPVYNSLRRPQLASPPVMGRLVPFELIDQDGNTFTSRDQLSGIVSVFSFVNAGCGPNCSQNDERLERIQRSLKSAWPTVRTVSITTAPDTDTPARLKEFGRGLNANFHAWTFLTGTPDQVQALIHDNLRLREADLTKLSREGWILVADQAGQVRDVSHITPGTDDVNKLVLDIAVLINSLPPKPGAKPTPGAL